MDEQRHFDRRETLAYWPVQQTEKGEAVGLVTNFSREGIQIHSKHTFSKGEILTIQIAVDAIFAGADNITMVVENAWCHASRVENLYHAGFKIMDISDRAKQSLRNLIEAFSYPVPGQQPHTKNQNKAAF